MAQTPLRKNPGSLLTSKFKGLIDVIPLKWRAKLGLTTLVQKQPVDIEPTPLGDLDADGNVRVVSSVQQELTDERKKTDTFIGDPIGSQMIEYFRTKDGQVGTRTHTVRAEGETLPSLTELIIEADQEAWGNGEIEQIVSTIPNLLGLYDYKVERPDRVPPDFGALLNTTEESHTEAGQAALPTLGTGELMREERQIDAQTKRVTVRYRDLASLPKTLVNKKTNEQKQIVTVTRIWVLDTTTPDVPTALQDTSFERLGDGTAIEERLGVPNVFGGADYKVEKRDRTPPEFDALLQVIETSFIIAGTSALPTLGAGELMKEEVQLTEFTKKITGRARNIALLPVTLVNYDTDNNKEAVQITRIWQLDSVSPVAPTAIIDTKYEDLGDGTAVQTLAQKAVFPGPVYGISVENLIPPKFRAHIPTTTSEITSTGTANPSPTLTAGEIVHEEQQVDVFNKRTKSISFDVTTRQVVDLENTEEYGGATLNVVYDLDAFASLPIQEGLLVVSSEVTRLGNGYEIRVTKRAQGSEWEELVGTEVDPRTGIIVGVKKQVVDDGTTGGVDVDGYHDAKPLDKWRTLLISSKLDPSSLPSPRTWETTVEHQFKNTLVGIAWVWAAVTGECCYDFDMALVLDLVEGYAGPCRAKITESFTVDPPADVVSPTIFCPQGHMVGFAWAVGSIGDDCDLCRAHAQTWAIPPTLHDEIEIGGAVTLDNGTFTSTLPATVPIGLPAPGTLITKACDVEPWRFNVFYRRLVEIYVPDCGA